MRSSLSNYITALLLGMTVAAGSVCAQTTSVLWNFESGIAGWKSFGIGGATVSAAGPADAHASLGALAFSHDQSVAVFGGMYNTNVPMNSWTSYARIAYWVKTSLVNNSNEVQIEIRESNGEIWKQRVRTVMTTSYQRVVLDLAGYIPTGFDVSAAGNDYSLDVSDINQVTFVFFPKEPTSPSVVTCTVDNIELLTAQPTSIRVEPSSFDFGTLSPAPGAFRFSSTSLTCTYFTAESAWHISVYTSNTVHEPALVSPASDTMLLKYHTPNFGGGIASPYTPPNPSVATNWGTFFAYVFDPDPDGSNGFVTKLATSAHFPSAGDIPFSFAVDAGGAVRTTYTGNVVFEFVVE